MSTLNTLLIAVLAIIPPSAIIRVILCLVQINTDPEQESLYKKRAVNVAIYAVISESVFGILTLIYNYLA